MTGRTPSFVPSDERSYTTAERPEEAGLVSGEGSVGGRIDAAITKLNTTVGAASDDGLDAKYLFLMGFFV